MATEHTIVAEIQTKTGWRYWTAPMPESELTGFLSSENAMLSEISCSTTCEVC